MSLYLVNPGVDLTLELFVSARLEEAVAIQFERIKDRKVRDTFVRKLEKRLEGLLVDCMDWDLKEPTEAQVTYAILVAKQLGIPLPSEARKYRFHMAMFLESYAEQARNLSAEASQTANSSQAEAAQRLVAARLKAESESNQTDLKS